MRPVLDDDIRVDRARLSDELRNAVSSGENILLLGGAGSGKTSALALLVAELENDGQRVAFVRGSLASSVHDLLALIWDALPERPLPKGMINFPKIGIVGGMPGPDDRGPSAEEVLRFVRGKSEGAIALAREIAALRRQEPVTIVLDEIYDVEIAEDLFGRARDLLWDLGHQWVLAAEGTQEAVLSRPPAGAFWGERVRISPLTPDEAAEVLRRRGFNVSAEEVLRGDRKSPPAMRDLLMAAVRADRGVPPPSEGQDEQSTPQRALLEALGALDRPLVIGDEELQSRLGWSTGYTSRVMRGLVASGEVLEESERRTTPGRPRKLYSVNATPEPMS